MMEFILVLSGLILGAICLSVGYALGKKKKIEVLVNEKFQSATEDLRKVLNK